MEQNKTRIARLDRLLTKEECIVERKALLASDKVAKDREWNKHWQYYEDAYPRRGFSYTPADWVKRQEYCNSEMKPIGEITGYLGYHRHMFFRLQWLKVVTMMGICSWAIIL